MSTQRRLTKIFSIVVILTMLFSGFSLPVASAQGKDGLKRQVNAQTGKVNFLGPESGRALPASKALGIASYARPADPGMALAKRFGPEFGLKNPARDLKELKTNHSENGRIAVRYRQSYQGIPVMGGELIVNTNDSGDLYSMNGEVSSDLSLPTEPTVTPEEAQQIALQGAAKWYEKTDEDFVASEPELWIYDESLLRSSTRPAELVWRMEVTPKDIGMPVRELVLINAEGGHISLHFNQVDTAWATSSAFSANNSVERYFVRETAAAVGLTSSADLQMINSPQLRTYTANNGTSLPGTFLCDQTQPTCTNNSNPHADAAHKYAIGTYNFYAAQYGRDSIDNNGMTIISSVHYDSNYGNAFWDGTQMVYGDKYGYPLADDVVGHELTHGVTQHESNLFYYYQSGAINESFSDLWGEYYDQTNGLGTDTAGVKWLHGEDIAGRGANRDMSNPPAFGDPDKMTSVNYYTAEDDNGGVHYNSGINNKAVYLMVDGGTFNGKTVTALGWVKTAAIYYEANTNLLTSGADYSDLYSVLQQSCTNLIGQRGITAADCVEVRDAIDAVEMNVQPVAEFNTDAPYCNSGDPITTVLSDNLESGTGNWTFTNGAYPRWQLDSIYGPYAHSGNHSLYADDYPDEVTDATARLTPLTIPSHAYLHFAQAYGFESGYNPDDPDFHDFDGGVLEYSLNGGASWVDAGSLMDYNGYQGTIFTGAGNPLSGRSAFVGSSHGYINTRLNLAPLAGQTVIFRWRMGLDEAAGDWGWWIDDVKVYQCLPDPVGIGKYDDTSSAWLYRVAWGRYNGSGPYNSTLTYSPTVGSTAFVSIIGRRFVISYTGDNNRGKLDVYVDGAKVGTIDEYSPTAQFQKKWVSPVLSAGTHQVLLMHAGGGTYVDIDAIEVKVPDEVAPSAITNLSAVTGSANGSVNLSWTAVGDDGNTGTASSYLVRYSTSPINGTNWDAASVFSNSLVPKASGNNETLTVNGLVPGLTYYFAVRAQDEDFNVGGVSNSPSAAAKSPPPVGVGVYDDTNSNWIYTGTWGSYTGSGPYNNSLRYTGTVGDSAQLTFTGTKFILTFTKDANRGSIDVFVDGNKITTLNAYAASLTFQQTYTSPSFTSGTHTLRLVHAGGSFIDIDAIQILGAPVPVPLGTYDDAHTAWSYSGSWASYSGAGPSANSLHYTSTVGDLAELTFTGTKFILTFTRDANRGSIDVYVDGSKVTTINAYSASLAFQQSYTSPSFASGTHMVRLVHAGGSFIDIDAIQIVGTPVPVPVGTYDDAHAAWSYSGSWASYSGAGPYVSTLHYTATVGDSAELTFTGAKFILTFTRDSNRGSIDVFVDGTKVTTINAYSASLAFQQSYTSPSFVSGTHTLRFVHAGGGFIDIDALEVKEPDLVAPSAISNLSAVTGTTNGSVNLSWAAVGDDGNTGNASSYLVRYSTSAITAGNWASATVFSNTLTPKAAGGNEILTVTGLTPGTIYYFAVRAQDEDLNLGGVSNSPSAVAKASTPVGLGTYDDTNSNWVYTGSWASYTGSGPYNNSLHYTATVGDSAELTFTGTKFILTFTKDANRGSIDVYVDGSKVTTIHAYAASLAFQQTYTSPSFAAGTHTVRLVHAGGSIIDIDAIQVVGAAVPVPVGTYDDAHPAWSYSGSWASYSGAGPYVSTLHYTGTVGDLAELTFTGTKFILTFTKDANRGSIDVFVDGNKITTLNTYSVSLAFQQSYTSPSFVSGTHTLRLVHAGGQPYIDIDAITILP